MKTFSVPVVHTTSGYILIQADTLQEAKQQCQRLSEDGVSHADIVDTVSDSEIMTDEMVEEK